MAEHPDVDVVVVGGGPAGLMAAEVLSAAGRKVTLIERMPTLGRKFLMAGRGGLNLTHSEPFEKFLARYGVAAEQLRPVLEAFPPEALVAWAEGLGQETFVGSSGRVFPKALKASPLLRAWIARLEGQGVVIRTRTSWLGWDGAGGMSVSGPDGVTETLAPRATILALGGASWARLGSDGAWAPQLSRRGVAVEPFRPTNCGFDVAWSEHFRERFAGQPLKTVSFGFAGRTVRGEAMITRYGLEGGAIYSLSAALRDAIETQGAATLAIDLRPDLTHAQIAERLYASARGQSVANVLRKALGLSPAAAGLLREAHGVTLPADVDALAEAIKRAPVRLAGVQPLDRAISTAGGVALDAVDDGLALQGVPGVWAVGEMLDWEAPTGGYLLQACMASGVAAARDVLVKT